MKYLDKNGTIYVDPTDPTGMTLLPPQPGPNHCWQNGAWVDFSAQIFAQAKSVALANIDQRNAQLVRQILGNPTTEEQSSWPVKLSISKSVLANSALAIEATTYFSALGLATAAQQTAWATNVQAKAAAASQIIGVADAVRTSVKVAVVAATDAATLAAALAAADAAALAAVTKVKAALGIV
jgi:hypothetical protein